MKSAMVAAAVLIGSASQARSTEPVIALECGDASKHLELSIVQTGQAVVATAGLLRQVHDTAELVCVGHKLNRLSCVGQWLGAGEEMAIVQVETRSDGEGFHATIHPTSPLYGNGSSAQIRCRATGI